MEPPRRVVVWLVLAAAFAVLVLAGIAVESTWRFRREVREIQRETRLMCDVEERSRWTPAPLERARCRVQREPLRFPLARRLADEDVERWPQELARGVPATAGDRPVDVTALQQVVCHEHHPSMLDDYHAEYHRAFVALLADASRLPPDECLAESVVAMQIAQRVAHVPAYRRYGAELEVTHLAAATLARCASTASPSAVHRAAQDLDALSRRPPPWIGASVLPHYVLAHEVASLLGAVAEHKRIVWPWSTTDRGSMSAWLQERRALVRRSAGLVRLACDVDSGLAPVEKLSIDTALRTQMRSSACLGELAGALSVHSSVEAQSARAILESAPSCPVTPRE